MSRINIISVEANVKARLLFKPDISMMKKGKGQNVTSYDKLSTNATRFYTVSECDKMAQN